MNTKTLNRRIFLKKGLIAAVAFGAANLNPYFAFAQSASKKETNLFKQINRAKDPEILQGLELGHVPRIKAPEAIKPGVPFEVEVRVGKKLHEMIPAHFIDWVDLYADEIFLTKFILTPNFTQPVCKVFVTLNTSATLRAIEHCNLHGLWEGTKPIQVL
ncbi:MAG: class II SORL domain-containing protein [Nitrospinaceae bacterium]